MKKIKQLVRGTIVTLLTLCLVSCTSNTNQWSLYNIEGHLPDLSFKLNGAHGKIFSEQDFRNKVVLMMFGYGTCPDVCPATLMQLNNVIKQLGNFSKYVEIIFISVDPKRDTPETLQKYLSAINKKVTGLVGQEEEIKNLARRYRVAYQAIDSKKNNKNTYISHGRGIYIFDGNGHVRLLATDKNLVNSMVPDLIRLIKLTKLNKGSYSSRRTDAFGWTGSELER